MSSDAERIERLEAKVAQLRGAILEHYAQKADDRCWMDDVNLWGAAGLDVTRRDLQVGDKEAMRRNCDRFIENRCLPGGWRTYAELEAEVARLRGGVERLREHGCFRVLMFEKHGGDACSCTVCKLARAILDKPPQPADTDPTEG